MRDARRLGGKMYGWLKKFPIKRQMYLVIGFVCFLSVFMISLNAYTMLKKKTLENYEQSGGMLLRETINKINSKLMLVENIVYNMSYDARVLNYPQNRDSFGTSQLDAYFSGCIELTKNDSQKQQILTSDALLDDVFLITDSDVFISRRENFSAYNIRQMLTMDCFRTSREYKGRRIWTDFLFNPTATDAAQSHHFMYLTYLMDENLQYNVGYLAASISLENLSRLLDELNTNQAWDFYIIDKNGAIIAGRNRAMITKPFSDDAETVKKLRLSEGQMFSARLGGQEFYMHAAPLRINGWKLLITMPDSVIYNELSTILVSTILIGVACLACLAALSTMVISNITNPLNEMVLSIKEIRDKNFSIGMSADGCYEISELSKEYNFMLERMDQLMNEIVEEQKALRQSQLKTLRAQINPHFLYNTLDTIKWLVVRGDYEKSEKLVDMLATFFRIGLSGGSEEIMLQEEMTHASQYLEIQKIRLSDRFDYFIDCCADLNRRRVPKLILQPIVENIILHAFIGMEGHGLIRISAKEDEGMLCITVDDNGCGMTNTELGALRGKISQPLSEVTAEKHGYALCNVNQRIILSCGSGYGLAVNSRPGKGTQVIVRLPIYLEM